MLTEEKPTDRHRVHPIHFEAGLAQSGLLRRLEEASIVPLVQNPNPFSPIEQETQHDEWWGQHQAAAEQFCAEMERRQVVLQLLHEIHIEMNTAR